MKEVQVDKFMNGYPCGECNRGWVEISNTGKRSCEENCGRHKRWKKEKRLKKKE